VRPCMVSSEPGRKESSTRLKETRSSMSRARWSGRRLARARSAPSTSWPRKRTRPDSTVRVSGLATSWSSEASLTWWLVELAQHFPMDFLAVLLAVQAVSYTVCACHSSLCGVLWIVDLAASRDPRIVLYVQTSLCQIAKCKMQKRTGIERPRSKQFT